MTVTHSDVRGGYPGEGNIDANPSFQNAARFELRLRADSPCIDVGGAENSSTGDFAGVPRPQGLAPDMGAYEYQDTDEDGMDDAWELLYDLSPSAGTDGDEDGDGDDLTNLQEYEMASDPRNPGDPMPDFHVSVSGSDSEGDGAQGNPWRTLTFALKEAAGHAAPFHRVTLHVQPGEYEERVVLAPFVDVEGAGPSDTKIIPQRAQLETDGIVVEAAESAALRDLSVHLPLDAPSMIFDSMPFSCASR